MRPPSRGGARPSCAEDSPSQKQRAQGKPGARCTRSLACELKKHTSVVTTGSPDSSGLPCAMVLTVSSALSPVTGLSCHRRLANCFTKLDASVGASGPHDFAVRGSAARQRVATCVHRIPHPTFVTTRTPLCVGRDGAEIATDAAGWKMKYFAGRDWTAQIRLNRFSKLSFTRMRFRSLPGRASEAARRKLIT